jgi:transposase-like protein
MLLFSSLLNSSQRRLLDFPRKVRQTDKPNPFPGQGNPADPELARLQRENARLQEAVEILKKAVGIGTSRSR